MPKSEVGTSCIDPGKNAGDSSFSGDYIEIDGKSTPAIILKVRKVCTHRQKNIRTICRFPL